MSDARIDINFTADEARDLIDALMREIVAEDEVQREGRLKNLLERIKDALAARGERL